MKINFLARWHAGDCYLYKRALLITILDFTAHAHPLATVNTYRSVPLVFRTGSLLQTVEFLKVWVADCGT